MPLKKIEREAIDRLVEGCRAHFGPRLIYAALFGSKARGDDTPDSDVDVLLVLSGSVDDGDRGHVADAAFTVLDAVGTYVHAIVLAEDEYLHPRGQLRWLTSFVKEEGVSL